jgi:hypothetical protein
MSDRKVRVVCATREKADVFFSKTALGRSLALYAIGPAVELRLFESNTAGLPQIYNAAIAESKSSPAALVFVHDDVTLCDFHWATLILEGLEQFHIIGLVGNRRRVPRQPSWAFVDEKFTWDSLENLSGVVGHGSGFPCRNLCVYGPPFQEVKLLDGLMLACASEVLLDKELFFDEQFDFHFYDLDFCRQAERKGLRMGTWRISAVHESEGHLGLDDWKDGYRKYLEKWHD